MYLLGWTGDYGDPDNFVGTFFRTPQAVWGFNNQAIFDELTKARDTATRRAHGPVQEANKLIMDFLPACPTCTRSRRSAFAPGVTGYIPSPVSIESFATCHSADPYT